MRGQQYIKKIDSDCSQLSLLHQRTLILT